MTNSSKSMVSFRLPNDLLEGVDQRAHVLGINRSQWFENMTRWALMNTYTTRDGITRAKEEVRQRERELRQQGHRP